MVALCFIVYVGTEGRTSLPGLLGHLSGDDLKTLSNSEGLLEIVGLEVTVEGVKADTHWESFREIVAVCRRCNAETIHYVMST